MLSLASRGRGIILLLAGLSGLTVLYLLTAYATGAGIVDDTYIFLRYVRNIWEGAGPVFNDGDRVEGYTSPLWLAVLTLTWTLRVDPPVLAVAASALTGYALLLVLFLWKTQEDSYSPMLAALFLSSNPSFVFWAWSGMDTALYTLLIVLTVLLLERDVTANRLPVRSGTALSLAAAARLEALWLVPLLVAILFVARRDRSPRFALQLCALCLPAIIVLGPHAIWRHAYYGSWLPNTFAAKLGAPKTPLMVKGVQYVVRAALTYAPLLLALVFGVRRLGAAHPYHATIPASCAGCIILYAALVGGDHFAMFRFLVPALALLSVIVGRFAVAAIEEQPTVARATAVIGVILSVNAFVLAGPQRAAARSEVSQAAAWAKTGRWCAKELAPGSIASMVVGAIPYYCDRQTYDLLGLVDAQVARHGKIHPAAPPGHQKYDTDYILERKPAYIFFLSSGMPPRPLFRTVEERIRWLDDKGFALKNLVTDPRTLQAYVYRAEQLDDGRWVEFLERRR